MSLKLGIALKWLNAGKKCCSISYFSSTHIVHWHLELWRKVRVSALLLISHIIVKVSRLGLVSSSRLWLKPCYPLFRRVRNENDFLRRFTLQCSLDRGRSLPDRIDRTEYRAL